MLQDDGESVSWHLDHEWKTEQLLRAGGSTDCWCWTTAGNGMWEPCSCKGVRCFFQTLQGPCRGFACPELAHPFTCSAVPSSSQGEFHSVRSKISEAWICSAALIGLFSESFLVYRCLSKYFFHHICVFLWVSLFVSPCDRLSKGQLGNPWFCRIPEQEMSLKVAWWWHSTPRIWPPHLPKCYCTIQWALWAEYGLRMAWTKASWSLMTTLMSAKWSKHHRYLRLSYGTQLLRGKFLSVSAVFQWKPISRDREAPCVDHTLCWNWWARSFRKVDVFFVLSHLMLMDLTPWSDAFCMASWAMWTWMMSEKWTFGRISPLSLSRMIFPDFRSRSACTTESPSLGFLESVFWPHYFFLNRNSVKHPIL